MGYDKSGIKKVPVVNKELRDELPTEGTKVNTLKGDGYYKFDSKLRALYLAGIILEDGTVNTKFVDNLKYGSLDNIELLRGYTTQVDATSAGSKEWTCPAGKIWILISVAYANFSRAYGYTFSVTPSGGTEAIVASAPSGRSASFKYDMIGNGYIHAPNVRVLKAGDKVKVNDPVFVGGDTVNHAIVYVELDAI